MSNCSFSLNPAAFPVTLDSTPGPIDWHSAQGQQSDRPKTPIMLSSCSCSKYCPSLGLLRRFPALLDFQPPRKVKELRLHLLFLHCLNSQVPASPFSRSLGKHATALPFHSPACPGQLIARKKATFCYYQSNLKNMPQMGLQRESTGVTGTGWHSVHPSSTPSPAGTAGCSTGALEHCLMVTHRVPGTTSSGTYTEMLTQWLENHRKGTLSLLGTTWEVPSVN